MNVSDIIGKEVLDKNANRFGKVIDIDVDISRGAVNHLIVRVGLTKKLNVMASNIVTVGDKVILNVIKEELEQMPVNAK